jgi:branched-chain amino acid transport system ATP-binding protein
VRIFDNSASRALIVNPKIVLLDEPTEGLAPIIVEELMLILTRLAREEHLSMIIVEQHARKVLKITDQTLILDRGMAVHGGSSSALKADPSTLERYVGVAGGTPSSEVPGRQLPR